MVSHKQRQPQSGFNLFTKDLGTLGNLIFGSENLVKQIAFFATQSQYYAYYQGLLDELANRNHKINYLTADPRDIEFFKENSQIRPYYSKSLLPLTFPLLTAPILVTTVPDIQQYQIKRSFSGTNYVYVFHALVSTHMMYRKGAFDYYDTIFCVGPHHAAEIRQTEKLYNLPPKTLHEVGYYRLEKIHAQHQSHRDTQKKSSDAKPLVLIATGWQNDNIIDTCANELITTLLKEDFRVVLRPHPMTIAHQAGKIDAIKNSFAAEKNFSIDIETSSEYYLHNADVMICDWSGVALEYAFGTERPVLFIDLPPKVYNPEYQKLGITPFEVNLRNQIGKSIPPQQVSHASQIILDFLDKQNDYVEQIIEARNKNIYNFGESARISANILEDIKEKEIQGWKQPF